MTSQGLLDKLKKIDSNYNSRMDKRIKSDLFKESFSFGDMTKDCLLLCHVLCHKEISYRKPRYKKEIIIQRHKEVSILLNINENDLEV